MKIRPYKKEDYAEISAWWKAAKEPGPSRDMMPEESSFILEVQGTPWIAVTVYLTNSPELAWVDNLIASPKMPGGEARAAAIFWLQAFLERWTKEQGYKKLFCMTEKEVLVKRYQDLGYEPTLKGVTTLIKIL